MRLREGLWNILHKVELNMTNMAVYWNMLIKQLQRILPRYQQNQSTNNNNIQQQLLVDFTTLVQRLNSWLNDRGYRLSTNILWKWGGYPVSPIYITDNSSSISFSAMIDISQQLHSLSNSINVQSLVQLIAERNGILSLALDSEYKRNIIQGICTMKYIQQQQQRDPTLNNSNIQELFESIQQLATLLSNQYQGKRDLFLKEQQLQIDNNNNNSNNDSNSSNNTHNNRNELLLLSKHDSIVSLLPLGDHSSILQERTIISEIVSLSLSPLFVDRYRSCLVSHICIINQSFLFHY